MPRACHDGTPLDQVAVDERTTIYFDEAGMADTDRLERLTEVVEHSGSKLVANTITPVTSV